MKILNGLTVNDNLTVSGTLTVNGNASLPTPAAPSNLVLTEVNDYVNVQFDQSASPSIDEYEIWRSETSSTSGFALIGIIKSDDAQPTMILVDDTYTKQGALYYRIYAVKNGARSAALTGSITTTGIVADVTNLQITEDVDKFIIQYTVPDDRRLAYVEIKVDAQLNSIDLAEINATTIYQGKDGIYIYKIPDADKDKYHQFWVYTVTRT